jgi:hypothetical protein
MGQVRQVAIVLYIAVMDKELFAVRHERRVIDIVG